jgi:hypothetical protein
LLRAGASLTDVQKIMRHSDPKLTANTYGHFSADYLRTAMGKLQLHASGPAETIQVAAVAVAGSRGAFEGHAEKSETPKTKTPGTASG